MSSNSRRYANVSLTPTAAAGLRRLTAQLTTALGSRVTLSDTAELVLAEAAVVESLLRLAQEEPGVLAETIDRIRRTRGEHPAPPQR